MSSMTTKTKNDDAINTTPTAALSSSPPPSVALPRSPSGSEASSPSSPSSGASPPACWAQLPVHSSERGLLHAGMRFVNHLLAIRASHDDDSRRRRLLHNRREAVSARGRGDGEDRPLIGSMARSESMPPPASPRPRLVRIFLSMGRGGAEPHHRRGRGRVSEEPSDSVELVQPRPSSSKLKIDSGVGGDDAMSPPSPFMAAPQLNLEDEDDYDDDGRGRKRSKDPTAASSPSSTSHNRLGGGGDGALGAMLSRLLLSIGFFAQTAGRRALCSGIIGSASGRRRRHSEASVDDAVDGLRSSPSGRFSDGFWDFSSGVLAPHNSMIVTEGRGLGGDEGGAVTNAVLGRSTWTLLHSVAAVYPENPSKRQQKDVKNLIESLARMYPCTVCAHHFQDIIRKDPPTVGSAGDLQQWMCKIHNLVNLSLGKPVFNCKVAASKWSSLNCNEDAAFSLTVGSHSLERKSWS